MTTTETPPAPPPGHQRRRRLTVWALIVVATLIAITSGLNTWVEREALNTDSWVEASSEVLESPEVQLALAEYVVDQLYANVDVSGELKELLPEDFSGLAGPISAALRQPATEAVEKLLASEQIQDTWATVNRAAHETLVRILEDETRGGLSTADGTVSLDLSTLVTDVGTQIGIPSSALDKIPDDVGTITLVQSDQLATAQTAVKAIKVMSYLLFALVVALYALAIYTAVGFRRATVRNIGSALIVAGIVLLVVRSVVGRDILSRIDDDTNRAAFDVIWLTATQLLGVIAWSGIAYGIGLMAWAVVSGPTRAAKAIRRFVAPAFNSPAPAVWGVAAVVLLLLVAWSPGTAFRNALTGLCFAALFGAGIELLRRQTAAEFPEVSFATASRGIAGRVRAGWNRISTRGADSNATGGAGAPIDVEQLSALADLHDRGGLTDAEFEAAKARILGSPS